MSEPPRRVTFYRDGRKIEAAEGQSVAAALWAHGDRVLSRSTKYHRPRGLSCGIGKCADCHMRVDGVPNVKTCVTPVRDGMRVEGQNAWPSVRHDVFRVNDIVWSRGFDHHRAFVRPRFLYPLFGAVIRRFAGWGRLPDAVPPPAVVEELRPDVLVIGAGPAGLAAAAAAAEKGATVLLVEEADRLGGSAARASGPVTDPDRDEVVPIEALLARWVQAIEGKVDVRLSTALAAAYRGGVYLARSADRLLAIKAPAVVIATGSYPAEAHFAHNERPGVMRATAVRRLLHIDRVVPGRNAVVYGAGADGLQTALDLRAAGVGVAAVVEPRDTVPGPAVLLEALERARVPVFTGTTVVGVRGWSRVKRVVVQDSGGRRGLACDLVVVAVGRKTAPEFFQSLAARLTYQPALGGAVPVLDEAQGTSVAGVFAAGDAGGVSTLDSARETGRIAGQAAALHTADRRALVEVPA